MKWRVYTNTKGTSVIRNETDKIHTTFIVNSRPATPDEILTEEAFREQKILKQKYATDFAERRDVKDAKSVASSIEFNLEWIVDRMSPEEWSALAKLLTKEPE
jgi:hypothetical protein